VWCLLVSLSSSLAMRELIGRRTAADLVSFHVKGRILASGKSGNFRFV